MRGRCQSVAVSLVVGVLSSAIVPDRAAWDRRDISRLGADSSRALAGGAAGALPGGEDIRKLLAAARPAVRERRPIAPVGEKLPDDWLTAVLTLEQKHLLTHEQRIARADAKVKQYWPNPFDPVPPENDKPA